MRFSHPEGAAALSKNKPNPKNKKASRGAESKEILDTPLPDRRALEGVMRELLPGFADDDSEIDDAQQIMYEAFDETSPRRQVALARKALEVSPDCADAYVLLAEYASTPAEQLELYEQGVAAGERALGDDGFQEYEGHFWGFLPTRPYMRAREGLANCLWEAGRREEAAEHCREMLRLNLNDNQGIRYRLAAMLFAS
jgi:tetratricopeptide (TPR) repeat protein